MYTAIAADQIQNSEDFSRYQTQNGPLDALKLRATVKSL